MSFLRVFDISTSVTHAIKVILSVFRGWSLPDLATIESLGLEYHELYAALCGILVIFIFGMIQRKGYMEDRLKASPSWVRYVCMLALIITTIIFGSYGIGYDAKSFIYLQF